MKQSKYLLGSAASANAFSWLGIPQQLWISTIGGPGWRKEKLIISGKCRKETEWTSWVLQGLRFLAKSVSFFVLSSVVSSALFYAFPLSLYIVSMQLSLLLATILRARDGVVVTFGLVCSSFVSISRGSTYRSYFRPEGDPSSKSVQRGNLLAARIGLNNLKPQSNMIMVIDSDQDLLLYMCSISKR